ncbi:hypothetical protein MPH_06307 [Macrophomina phaseolina MS6]|uniref:Uncharacterized protein n=1 Tax=Macrophomina phaseolina (strain MS6) TaxID=1126212 RepID=K2R2P7_MACPH|nr:hypothetical protein MPH_06307 [Macrophomina phaseolina MS6]
MSATCDHSPPLGANSPCPDPEPPPAQETAASQKAPDVSQFPKPPLRLSFKPQCTHVNMVRTYGATCQNCNRKSPLGWIYQCAYDNADDPWCVVANRQAAVDACEPSDLIGRMEALEFNRSVISQAEKGLYTTEQMECLVSQKLKVLEIINSQSPDKAAADFRAKNVSATATAVAKERAKHLRSAHPRCRFKCCQTCRGDFRARAFESFDAVFCGDVKPLRLADTASLPVHDVQVVRGLGTKSLPLVVESSFFGGESGGSDDEVVQEQGVHRGIEHQKVEQQENVRRGSEPSDDDSRDSERASVHTWRTTDSTLEFRNRETAQARTFYRVEPVDDIEMYESLHFNDFSLRRSVRNSMSTAVKHIFRKRRDSSSDGSAVTLPVAGLQKASSKGFQDSGLSLPRSFFSRRNPSTSAMPPSTIIREGIPTPALTCSTNGNNSENGSINDEDGGVSLTQESARMQEANRVFQRITA